MSLRDDILAFDDLQSEVVTIKEWKDKKVIVKSMSAGERYNLTMKCVNAKTKETDGKKLYIHTIIECSFDPETGEKLFLDSDYDALCKKNSGAVEKILEAANRLNGLSEEFIKETEKN